MPCRVHENCMPKRCMHFSNSLQFYHFHRFKFRPFSLNSLLVSFLQISSTQWSLLEDDAFHHLTSQNPAWFSWVKQTLRPWLLLLWIPVSMNWSPIQVSYAYCLLNLETGKIWNVALLQIWNIFLILLIIYRSPRTTTAEDSAKADWTTYRS